MSLQKYLPIVLSIIIINSIYLIDVVNTRADNFVPSLSCYEPSKPYSFSSEWDRQNSIDDFEEYKRCIQNFVQEQEEAIEDAINEWNNFVDNELN